MSLEIKNYFYQVESELTDDYGKPIQLYITPVKKLVFQVLSNNPTSPEPFKHNVPVRTFSGTLCGHMAIAISFRYRNKHWKVLMQREWSSMLEPMKEAILKALEGFSKSEAFTEALNLAERREVDYALARAHQKIAKLATQISKLDRKQQALSKDGNPIYTKGCKIFTIDLKK